MSIFTSVARPKIRHNTFDLSHERKFSMDIGKLTPCFVAETVPNDYFRIDTSQLARFAPMVAPVMHRFTVYVHFWYVPTRILWKGFEKFINGGTTGEEAPVFPFISPALTDTNPATLGDYMGLPQFPADPDFDISAVPFAAYQKVWYEFYRDQNLTTEIDWLEPDGDGLSDGSNQTIKDDLMTLRKRAWQHDYFTSALPWTQRGPQATIPLGTTADITGDGDLIFNSTTATRIRRTDGGNVGGPDDVTFVADGTDPTFGRTTILGNFAALNVAVNHNVDPTTLQVDLSSATAATINDLRRAFRLQEWLELNARAGSRYAETILAHFDISVGDARLQRPQFLGGSATPLVISEVLQTSGTASEPTPQGNMAGHGVSMGGKNIVNYKCREHGYIIGVISVMPKTAYQQGIPKHFQKFDKFDYFWKSFANIGEQAIYNKEIYIDGTSADDDVFGYTPRYAEYKYLNDSVHGEFRDTLDFWHAGRIFGSRPTLSADFVECDSAEVDRIFAVVESIERVYVQMYHKVKARRPMPYFGTPTI